MGNKSNRSGQTQFGHQDWAQLGHQDWAASGAVAVNCDPPERGRRPESAAAGIVALVALVASLAVLLLCGGCATESAKVVEGTDLSVGFSLPMAEGEGNFTLFNWLSGFKTTTSESSRVKLRYTCAETNDYFGCIATRSWKTVDAEIEPVVDEPAKEVEEVEKVEGVEGETSGEEGAARATERGQRSQ